MHDCSRNLIILKRSRTYGVNGIVLSLSKVELKNPWRLFRAHWIPFKLQSIVTVTDYRTLLIVREETTQTASEAFCLRFYRKLEC